MCVRGGNGKYSSKEIKVKKQLPRANRLVFIFLSFNSYSFEYLSEWIIFTAQNWILLQQRYKINGGKKCVWVCLMTCFFTFSYKISIGASWSIEWHRNLVFNQHNLIENLLCSRGTNRFFIDFLEQIFVFILCLLKSRKCICFIVLLLTWNVVYVLWNTITSNNIWIGPSLHATFAIFPQVACIIWIRNKWEPLCQYKWWINVE